MTEHTSTKRALITGVTGQDGSYLSELLLKKGYHVYGLIRWSTQSNCYKNLVNVINDQNFHIVHGDLTDQFRLGQIIDDVQPNEVYNLASQSHVGKSFQIPEYTANVTAIGALNVLEAIRTSSVKDVRFYQASSSEMFGKVSETPQNESTQFHPRSPYGVSKVFAHYMTKNYRESYDMFAVSGIMFNHESERRGYDFVTRKITRAVANIVAGKQDTLELGNLDPKRDWGYAPDYVHAMWLMLQAEQPADYVVGTGKTHSVQDFVDAAFAYVQLDPTDYIVINPAFVRPAEVDLLCADHTAISKDLGWLPNTTFEQLVGKMVENDLRQVSTHA